MQARHPVWPKLAGAVRAGRAAWAALGAVSLLLATAPQAQTLYRIVEPDGRITYTDRPAPGAVATPLGAASPARQGASAPGTGAASSDMTSWPAPLREAALRFPVTLYAAEGCTPCDQARRLLQRRGVPYTERRVHTEEDARRLEQLTGSRLVPAATVGRQVLSGFQEQEWGGWLDSAAYPRTPMLPPGWQAAGAMPLAPRPPAAASAAAALTTPSAAEPAGRAPAPTAPVPGPGTAGIRF